MLLNLYIPERCCGVLDVDRTDYNYLLHSLSGDVPGILALGLGAAAGAALAARAIRAALRRFRSQMVWLILGLMAGSLYAIVMGPAGLQTPQTPVSLQTFSLPGFLLGAAVLLLLELLRAHRPNAEKSSR